MEIGIGLFLALAVGVGAATTGLDRERAFYATVLIMVASYNVLFAVMAGSGPVFGLETALSLAFVATALIGFRKNLWIVALGLAAHGLFDLGHGLVVENPGVPGWWPGFCMAYDLAAAVVLSLRLWWPGARNYIGDRRGSMDPEGPYFGLLRETPHAAPGLASPADRAPIDADRAAT